MLLRELCSELRIESSEIQAEARSELAAAPCLIAYHPNASKKAGTAVAVDANGCFVGDNQRYVELFEPLTAPEDEELKALYTYLGVRPLSEAVEMEAVPMEADGKAYLGNGTSGGSSSRIAVQVAERIRERACLLLHDIDKPDCPLRANLRDGMRMALRGSARCRLGGSCNLVHLTIWWPRGRSEGCKGVRAP